MKTIFRWILLAMMLFCAGCLGETAWSSDYVAHPDQSPVGWKCPPGGSHFVTYIRPKCAWIAGDIVSSSCRDEDVAALEKARGCVPVQCASASGAAH